MNKKFTRMKLILLILSFVFLIFISSVIGLYFYVKNEINKPNSNSSEEIVFSVKQGEGIYEIGENLEENGLINKIWFFAGYLKCKGLTSEIKAGDYKVKKNMNLIEIISILTGGKVAQSKITIIEGLRKDEIASYIEEEGISQKEIFLEAIKKNYNYGFLSDKPEGRDLEGYLFPDTYSLSYKSDSSEVINKMLDNFDKKLTSKFRAEIEKRGKSIYEIITLASVVEKEVSDPEERKIVAGIFLNRIKEGKPLQSCATIQYILRNNKKRFSYEETRIESPYNTYTNLGLPPGPICNPSFDSIKAAIYPNYTEYRYFLSDGNGGTHFAVTEEEHNMNIEKYLQ